MPISEIKLEYSLCSKDGKETAAVIVAAGNSSRMGGLDKQMLKVMGVPVLARTLQKFQNTPEIDSIVVVTKADKIHSVQLLAEDYGISKLTDIVEGGASRQESVKNGIDRLGDNVGCVLIHDGARPLVSESVISKVVQAVWEFGAAACGVRVYDTVKKIDSDGNIIGTVDRNCLVRIQTPQGFDLEKYRDAVAECPDISKCTDDCAIMESVGHKIKLIEGEETNIKVTTPSDVAMAERILNEEE